MWVRLKISIVSNSQQTDIVHATDERKLLVLSSSSTASANLSR
jgi:hypothetical protein